MLIETFRVYEPNIPLELTMDPISASEISNRSFHQILLDSMIHHFIIDMDSRRPVQLNGGEHSLNQLICLGFDDSRENKRKIIILDAFNHFVGINY